MRPLPPSRSVLVRVLPVTIALTGLCTRIFGATSTHIAVTWAVLWHTLAGVLFTFGLRPLFRSSLLRGSITLWMACAATGVIWALVPLFNASISHALWVVWIHVAAGLMLLPAVFGFRALRPRVGELPAVLTSAWLPAWVGLGSAAALGAYAYSPAEVFREVTSTHPRQAGNDLFPSGARIAEGWRQKSLQELRTGCQKAGCHTGVHAGGLRELHGPISKPLSVALNQATSDTRAWCLGCHAPTLLTQPAFRRLTVAGSPSIDCLGCHAPHPATPIGGGSANWPSPADYTLGRWSESASKYLLRLRPAPHQSSFRLPSKENQSLICAPCHRVSVPAHLNEFHHLTLGDTYREWLDATSLSSVNRIRHSQSPPDCSGCHGNLRKQSIGRATAVEDQPVRMELFALRTVGSDGVERLFAPLVSSIAVVSPLADVTIDLLIENRNLGHRFPATRLSFKDSVVNVNIRDQSGKVVAHSMAKPHHVGAAWLNRNGRSVTNSNKNEAAISALDTRLPTGSEEMVRFRWTVPNHPGEALFITANWTIEEFSRKQSFASPTIRVRIQPKDAAQDGQPIPFADKVAASSSEAGFIRYGEALIKRGEPGRARRAMQQAMRLNPAGESGARGLIAAHLAEGDLLAARTQVDLWNARKPNDMWGQYVSGLVLLRMGQYVAAVDALERVAEWVPGDFDVRMNAALSRFRLGDYSRALEHYDKALNIDPIDSRAHYNRMQCLQRLRRLSEARREEAIFQSLREDEPLRDVLRNWEERFPESAKEAVPDHEHWIMPSLNPPLQGIRH